MSKILKSRFGQIVIVIFLLMTILFLRLFMLTVIQKEKWTEAATNLSIKSIYTPAPRGQIFDRYGKMLAGNVQSFSVCFSASDIDKEEANEIAKTLIEILESNGDTYNDNLPILIENGRFVYTYQKDIEEWLEGQDMPADFTAEQAFNMLRTIYEIDPQLDKFEAQTALQEEHKVYPPISVKNMVFSKDLDKKIFLGRYRLAENLSAEEAFAALRVTFGIDKTIKEKTQTVIVRSEMSDAEARKIMVVRNEVISMGYMQYIPATIASNVSDRTVIQIEEKSRNLPGVDVVSETMRVYPNGNSTSHVLGYLGHISEQDKEKYVGELGYNPNDMIGLDGIENRFERTLKGTDGTKYVQVNVNGELVKVIDEKPPVKGKDVYLTIDLELQKVAENALEQALQKLQVGGTFESKYGNYKYNRPSPNANVGAVVAIEVDTGDVLAMASYPNYDPNLFAMGISKSDWNALQSKNPRDPISPLPLYNVAARTAIQPGSTFKMVTATAALESGLDPKLKLYDGGHIMVGNQSYGCLIWNTSRGSHGSLTLAQALEVSCNYYFYDIATGRDHYRNRLLGYKAPINIDRIMYYAQQYGLGLKTGIEIGETVVPVPDDQSKMRQTKNALRSKLTLNAEKYFKPEVVKDKDLLEKYISEIVSWTEENPSRKEILRRMPDQGVPEEKVIEVTDLCKFSYFNFAKWTLGDEFNISIGQGENMYTPLQMANYLATIGNNGVHNKVSLISAIEGQGLIEREAGTKINIKDDSELDEIIKGMKLVASGSRGSLKNTYGKFPALVAAKTGTAQKDGRIQPPDEIEYMKANLSRIASYLKWEDVEAETSRLMKERPETFSNKNVAVRQAVINLSGGKVNYERMDEYKSKYKPYAWVLSMAPADNPKIAVVVLLFQGDTSLNAAPVAREVIGKYLQLDKTYEDININTAIQ